MQPGTPEFSQLSTSMLEQIGTVVEGKREAVRTAVLVLLAGGHLLVEDVPGVGKTLLARSLAETVGGRVSRIQFTPDLLPSDITGVSVFHQERHDFEFRPGPVFANIVIGDEINRASAKTQSALLESMEEHQVTVDGTTHRLPEPFMVVATQNPADSHGTFPLPEAQRDRFMARISLGYPDLESEVQMLAGQGGSTSRPTARIRPVTDPAGVTALIDAVSRVTVSEPVLRHIVALGRASREHRAVRVGASPRSLVQWMRAVRAEAALEGRSYAVPDDVTAVAPVVLPHRLLLAGGGAADRPERALEVVRDLLAAVPAPSGQAAGRTRRAR